MSRGSSKSAPGCVRRECQAQSRGRVCAWTRLAVDRSTVLAVGARLFAEPMEDHPLPKTDGKLTAHRADRERSRRKDGAPLGVIAPSITGNRDLRKKKLDLGGLARFVWYFCGISAMLLLRAGWKGRASCGRIRGHDGRQGFASGNGKRILLFVARHEAGGSGEHTFCIFWIPGEQR